MFYFLLLFILSGCAVHRPDEYHTLYAHLQALPSHFEKMEESDYFLVVLVDARHLDYTCSENLLGNLVKNPETGCTDGRVGHAWILLKGNGRVLEGGHSGELGVTEPKYLDGIMNYIEYGRANPTDEEKEKPLYEPNPARYLWSDLHDGYFEKGRGRHKPTFAAKIDLTKEQFEKIVAYIHPKSYNYCDYSFTRHQCCTFVADVAALADWTIEPELFFTLAQQVEVGGRRMQLWTDPLYSQITLATPDMVEKSLIESVKSGRAQYALDWYLEWMNREKTTHELKNRRFR